MRYAYPSPSTQKPNGALVNDRIPGMTIREVYLKACLEGFASSLIGKPISAQEIEQIAESCLRLADRLSESV